MERIDASIRVSLHLDPEDTLPIPECVEFPRFGIYGKDENGKRGMTYGSN